MSDFKEQLRKFTMRDLQRAARGLNLWGRSGLRKDALIDLLLNPQQRPRKITMRNLRAVAKDNGLRGLAKYRRKDLVDTLIRNGITTVEIDSQKMSLLPP